MGLRFLKSSESETVSLSESLTYKRVRARVCHSHSECVMGVLSLSSLCRMAVVRVEEEKKKKKDLTHSKLSYCVRARTHIYITVEHMNMYLKKKEG